jgi:hypothetical protein
MFSRFMVGEEEELGTLTSLCVWTEGEHCLLPRTERILFLKTAAIQDLESTLNVSCDDAVAIVGHRMVSAASNPRGVLAIEARTLDGCESNTHRPSARR